MWWCLSDRSTSVLGCRDRSTAPATVFPDRPLSQAQLARYLDYCSELLALISKLAALLAQRQQDVVVLSAVNDIEALTSGLSRKIWQKITILDIAARLPDIDERQHRDKSAAGSAS